MILAIPAKEIRSNSNLLMSYFAFSLIGIFSDFLQTACYNDDIKNFGVPTELLPFLTSHSSLQ